jgi:uncharacterized protein
MKILIDIGHPAHVHFFKHFIWTMQKEDHQVFITAVKKDIATDLLDKYGFEYTNLGEPGNIPLKKVLNIPLLDYRLYTAIRQYNPDVFTGIASFRAAHVAFLKRKVCVVFDDTEHNNAEWTYMPFTSYVCSPTCYRCDLGRKQIRYNGYHELAYLHPNRFTPDRTILEKYGISVDKPFVVLRFVGWQALHDIGHTGLDMQIKIDLVKQFSKHARVYITSEKPLPPELDRHRLSMPPNYIHHLLAFATLLYGESATMASECAVLGTPAIYIDNVGRGYTDEQEHVFGSVFNFRETPDDIQASIRKGLDILTTPDIKAQWRDKSAALIKQKIDVTDWMVDFVKKAVP